MRICSTRPVQEPQLALALVCLRTSSSVNRPLLLDRACRCVPLVTPLQPQTSAVVGHGLRRWLLALVAGVAEMRLAEHQLVAHVVPMLPALAQQLEVPGAVDGVAVEAGADQPVVAQHQLLVDAAGRIAQDDLLGVRAAQ